MPKTAAERFTAKKDPKIVVLDKDFAGMKQGQTMFVATPQLVADYMRKIPHGETRTIQRMRLDLARRRKCDGACPVSTAIFIRLAADAACEEMEAGRAPDEVIPFWRLISSADKVAGKLSIDPAWIDERRAMESKAIA